MSGTVKLATPMAMTAPVASPAPTFAPMPGPDVEPEPSPLLSSMQQPLVPLPSGAPWWSDDEEVTVGQMLEQQRSTGRAVAAQASGIRKMSDALTRPLSYWLFHSFRLFGYGYILPVAGFLRPMETVGALAAYIAIHRQRWWQRTVHKFFRHGVSKRHRIVNPNLHLHNPEKRYLICAHPHSVLADGMHSFIANDLEAFEKEGPGVVGFGRRLNLCFAPIIQHVPVHQEMYRENCGAADKNSIVKCWETPDTDPALMPGGFPESVFADAGQRKIEYSYIKDRKGFVKICLEEGKDIIPIYTFKATWMYHNPGFLKGLRARYSQKISLGLVWPIGKWGTAMPLSDETVSVVFPPFEASKYRPDQLNEAHQAYMDHLKEGFDKYKADCGMADVELKFVGNDFQDDDAAAKFLRRVGILSKQVNKAKPAPIPRSKL